MIWIDEKFINFISHRLTLFKMVKPNVYTFRCPICNDSKTNKYKTRGGFYVPPKAQSYNMGCFNCGASMKFSSFLKLFDPVLYDEYQLEVFQEKGCYKNMSTDNESDLNNTLDQVAKIKEKKEKKQKRLDLSTLDKISELDETHPAVQYIMSRKIPKKHWRNMYYCPNYFKWIHEFDNKKYNYKTDHPRLIIPFYDKNGNITRISARAFGAESPKYLYTVVDSNSSRLYGLDRINTNELVYVLEGPLDSLFFDNAIAIGSASYTDYELNNIPNKVFVPDNEPRNEDVCKQIKKVIDSGEKVCIWQENTAKDINQMIISGKSISSIIKLIEQSTFSGTEAELMYNSWIKF